MSIKVSEHLHNLRGNQRDPAPRDRPRYLWRAHSL